MLNVSFQSSFSSLAQHIYRVLKPGGVCVWVVGDSDVVLDPFAGSGTTILAAKRLERLYLGIECSDEYVDLCRLRLSTNR